MPRVEMYADIRSSGGGRTTISGRLGLVRVEGMNVVDSDHTCHTIAHLTPAQARIIAAALLIAADEQERDR